VASGTVAADASKGLLPVREYGCGIPNRQYLMDDGGRARTESADKRIQFYLEVVSR
jgi:hypothetical protein